MVHAYAPLTICSAVFVVAVEIVVVVVVIIIINDSVAVYELWFWAIQ